MLLQQQDLDYDAAPQQNINNNKITIITIGARLIIIKKFFLLCLWHYVVVLHTHTWKVWAKTTTLSRMDRVQMHVV